MQLSTSERFLNEYAMFKEKINSIEDEKTKAELNKLLVQIVAEVKSIDNLYRNPVTVSQASSAGSDHRSNLISLRKKLSSALETYNR